MHELAICEGILGVAKQALEGLSTPAARIARVTVRIGRLTSVMPDSLRYYFDVLTPGTPLEGSNLTVEEVPIRGCCGDCGGRFQIELLSFTCPRCGSGLVELVSGRELEVVSLETLEEVPRGD